MAMSSRSILFSCRSRRPHYVSTQYRVLGLRRNLFHPRKSSHFVRIVDVGISHVSNLAMRELNTGDSHAGRLIGFEPMHDRTASLDRAMILLDDGVQVRTASNMHSAPGGMLPA